MGSAEALEARDMARGTKAPV